jgi:tRNA-specific 2-thiouridylase
MRKDQSYVLGMLTQGELARTLLPIGHLNKDETRRRAAELGFCVAAKPDSQEICFVEDGDYARFVIERAPELAAPGPILDNDGRELGEHRGLARYTVGQRKGLGIAAPQPLFVTSIDTARNALVVGPRDALKRDGLVAENAKWSSAPIAAGAELLAQTRAHASPWPVKVVAASADGFEIAFNESQAGVSPGQMCVLYAGDEVVGAGTIA